MDPLAQQPVWNKVVIVGVGLLGGSIGLALRTRSLARQVVGVGRAGKPPHGAVAHGAIDVAAADVRSAAQNADLVICCTPVQQIAELVACCIDVIAPSGLITDVGSTKRTIVDQVRSTNAAAPFVGSHPLAGGTSTGYEHARADLLDGSLVIVTPDSHTSDDQLARIEQLWRSLGAETHRMSPADHDEALAQTSHLPHIVASALSSLTPLELLPLTGPGWRGTTRIAKGNAKLWRQILEENRFPALHALKNFAKVLEHWQRALESDDGERLEQLLEAGKATRDALGS